MKFNETTAKIFAAALVAQLQTRLHGTSFYGVLVASDSHSSSPFKFRKVKIVAL